MNKKKKVNWEYYFGISINEIRELISKGFEYLTSREKEILIKTFGLSGGNYYTLKEVGEVYGVDKERIRQIEAVSIAKVPELEEFRLLAIHKRNPLT